MKYLELTESCRRAIEEGRCTGCQALENDLFFGNKNCEHNKIPKAEESIKAIFKQLGVR